MSTEPSPAHETASEGLDAPSYYPLVQSTEAQSLLGSCVLGGVAALLIAIGLFVDTLSLGVGYGEYYYDSSDEKIGLVCGFNEVSYKFNERSYDLSGFSYDDACDLEEPEDEQSWCDVQSAANTTMVFMIIAIVTGLIAVFFVNPYSKVKPCLCRNNASWTCRVLFLLSFIEAIIPVIAWSNSAGDCLGDNSGFNSFTMKLGPTMFLTTGGGLCNLIACFIIPNNIGSLAGK